jgi:APA family basic amino acid/polyamine antiporter
MQALGRDRLGPKALSRVHRRLRTPHVALLAVGLPICGLVVLDRLEILAETASALRLLIYALICAALWTHRRREPTGGEPAFRVPLGSLVAITAAVGCVGLLVLVEPPALVLGGGALAAGGLCSTPRDATAAGRRLRVGAPRPC